MGMTEDQAKALARFAHLYRPEWDEVGILRKLEEVCTRNPLDVGMALMRLLADTGARTPGVLPKDGPHWRERVATPEQQYRHPPKPHEECSRHPGQYRLSCGGCAADKRAEREAAAGIEHLDREAAVERAREAVAAAQELQRQRDAEAEARTTKEDA